MKQHEFTSKTKFKKTGECKEVYPAMKRFRFNYTLKRDPECGQEIILARTKKEATGIFNDMVAGEPDTLAYQAESHTPDYYEIKVVQVKELDDNS